MALKQIDHGSSDYQMMISLRDELLRRPLGLAFTEEELEREEMGRQRRRRAPCLDDLAKGASARGRRLGRINRRQRRHRARRREQRG